MITALLIFIAVMVVALVAVVVVAAQRALPGPPLLGRTVVINTVRPDDQTIRGVLLHQHADRLELTQAVVVTAAGEQPTGGTIAVPVGRVAWMQILEG